MDILNLIYESIDEINLDLESGKQIEKREDAILFGANSNLDSMGLVNLITIVEQKIEDITGEFISIADERAMSMEYNPFSDVSSLKKHVEMLLDENKN
ncbi:MAG: hypothetical protein IPP48_05685 [Chitinophagaceae bacterium]|nr:hypothetical protein [Chitinophagaceae bacterium]